MAQGCKEDVSSKARSPQLGPPRASALVPACYSLRRMTMETLGLRE